MRSNFLIVMTIGLIAAFAGCADAPTEQAIESESAHDGVAAHGTVNGMPDDDDHRSASGMPDDDVHPQAMGGTMGSPDHNMGINRSVNLPDEIQEAWSGVKVRLVDVTKNQELDFEVDLGSSVQLGESGLMLAASMFIPSFVMDQGGITSRGPEPDNPAVRVVITGTGAEPYEGWLFANMRDIHPFPHDRYAVFLIEGIPSK